MKDVTGKPETLRVATAATFVSVPPPALELVRRGGVEKGDPLQVAKVAAVMGAKRTAEIVPYCHPVALTHVDVELVLDGDGIAVTVTATAIAPTGVEMEALCGASIAALTLYDMLKPHADGVEIGSLRLVAKSGGKRDYRPRLDPAVSAAVVVLSDRVAAGRAEDRSGRAIADLLATEPGVVVDRYEVLPDEPDALRRLVVEAAASGVDLLVAVGGTGLGPRDRTVDTLRELFDFNVPGIAEAARAYGQRRTRYAMLSRGVAGFVGGMLVVTYPGSHRGAVETHQALFPALLHAFEVRRQVPHSDGPG
jgi:molybdenum cofactor biosynthesis protein MoaC